MIDEVYGEDRIEDEMELRVFLILNWSLDSRDPTQLARVELDSRRDLLPAIMKSPGPFFQFSDGSLYQDSMSLDEQAYIDALQGVTILEASGGVDIPQLQQELYQWLKADR